MNELQKVRGFVIEKFNSDNLVNTITTLTNDLIDTNHTTIFPLVNLGYKGFEIKDEVILISYEIKVLDQNDVYTGSTDSKLLQDTNAQDILNETFNICQKFVNSFNHYNDLNIEVETISTITAILNENLNGLSGHTFEIILSIPNEGSSCQ